MMSTAPAPLPWQQVVFVADTFEPSTGAFCVEDRGDLEKTDAATLHEVLDAIVSLGAEAIHVEDPRALVDIAAGLRDAVIFSTFGGEASRNRLLLVPAVAETLGLDYVGMDAVGHALAANKREAKRLAAECGVLTPRSRVIRSARDLTVCDAFPMPYVVKPIAEGSSIGIGPRSLVRDAAVGREVAGDLLTRFAQPVLIEAFVPGREVSLVVIETQRGWHELLVEIQIAGEPGWFDDHLFDAGEKQARLLPRSVQPVTAGLCPADREAIHRFLSAVGHFGYGRVDGKLHDGRFHFLELTPDAWLGKRGQLAEGFMHLGWSYEAVIGEIIRSASLRSHGRAASG